MDIRAAGQQPVPGGPRRGQLQFDARVIGGARDAVSSLRAVDGRVVSVEGGRATLQVANQQITLETEQLKQGQSVQLSRGETAGTVQVRVNPQAVRDPGLQSNSQLVNDVTRQPKSNSTTNNNTAVANSQNAQSAQSAQADTSTAQNNATNNTRSADQVNTQSQASPRGPELRDGQIIRATVVATERGRVTLDINGTQVSTALPKGVKLETGSTVELRVNFDNGAAARHNTSNSVTTNATNTNNAAQTTSAVSSGQSAQTSTITATLEIIRVVPSSENLTQDQQVKLSRLASGFQPAAQSLSSLVSQLQRYNETPTQSQLAPVLNQVDALVGQLEKNPTLIKANVPSAAAVSNIANAATSTKGPNTQNPNATVINTPVTTTSPSPASSVNNNNAQAVNALSNTPVITNPTSPAPIAPDIAVTAGSSNQNITAAAASNNGIQITGALNQLVDQLVSLGQNNAAGPSADRIQQFVTQLINTTNGPQQLQTLANELTAYAARPETQGIAQPLMDLANIVRQTAESGVDRQNLRALNTLIAGIQRAPQAEHVQSTVSRLQEALGQMIRPQAPRHALQQLRSELNHLTQLPRVDALRPELQQLLSRIDQLIIRPETLNASALQQTVNQSGVNYEANLMRTLLPPTADSAPPTAREINARANSPQTAQAIRDTAGGDLKSMMMRVMNQMDAESLHQTLDSLSRAVRTHLSQVEGQQANNVLAQSTATPMRFEAPIQMDGRLNSMLVSIAQQAFNDSANQGDGGHTQTGNSSQSNQPYRVLFMMDTEGLGRTRVDASVSQNRVMAVFYVEDPIGLSQMKEDLPELHDAFRVMSYDEIHLDAKGMVTMTPPVQRDFDQLEGAPVMPIPVPLLDVVG